MYLLFVFLRYIKKQELIESSMAARLTMNGLRIVKKSLEFFRKPKTVKFWKYLEIQEEINKKWNTTFCTRQNLTISNQS